MFSRILVMPNMPDIYSLPIGIHELTNSLRFLGVILRVLRVRLLPRTSKNSASVYKSQIHERTISLRFLGIILII
jgi:hypothetical protein